MLAQGIPAVVESPKRLLIRGVFVRHILILGALITYFTISGAWAAGGKLVLVTMGGTSLNEITSPGLPNISRLIRQGAVGVMNARPAGTKALPDDIIGQYPMEFGCATIGAGTRTAATVDARRAYNAVDVIDGRSVRQLYESLYGNAPGSAQVLHLGMNRLKFINQEAKYPIDLGALGTVIRSAGLKTAAVGNSDTPVDPRREAALIAADENGIIDYGDVGSNMILRDVTAPYGIRSNSDALIEAFKRAIKNADFVVVDIGDTARAASYAQHCLEEQGLRLRRLAIEGADRTIGEILKSLDLSRDLIIIVSPNPSSQAIDEFDFLPPVITAGCGIRHGLLTSGSTRRSGIIMNTDISATVLDFFGLGAPYSFVGRITTVSNGSAGNLIKTNCAITRQAERQPIIQYVASFLVVFVVFLSLYAFLKRQALPSWVRWAALLPIVLFLGLLWLPAIADFGVFGTVVVLIGLIALIFIAARIGAGTPGRAFAWLCSSIVLTSVIDLSRGAVLLRDSIMSYTPVNGARYYGIGNEHMGSVISAAMIAFGFLGTVLVGKRAPRMLILTALLLIVVVGMGTVGSNVGGALSAGAAAVTGLVLWRGKKIDKRYAGISLVLVLAALGLLVLADLMRSGNAQSHIGRAILLIQEGGAGQILTIIERKAAMNLLLIQHSAWSKLLFSTVAAVAIFLFARGSDVTERFRANRFVHSGVIAAAVGSLAALLFNDSGVVAAATAFIYVWTAVLIVGLPEKEAGIRN